MTPHNPEAYARPTSQSVLGMSLDTVREPATGQLREWTEACMRHYRRRFDRVALFHECSRDDAFEVMEFTLDSGLDPYLTDTILIDPGSLVDACRRLDVEAFISGNLSTLTHLHGAVGQRWLIDEHGPASLPPGVQRVPTMTQAVLKVFPALRPGQLESLGPADRGLFRIRTAGSDHLWWARDDGSILWQRLPGPGLRSLGAGEDGTWIQISRVERFPRRGDRAKFWFDDPAEPFAIEQWRYISLVAAIFREPAPEE